MATSAQQTMENVESRRLQLEDTVAKFRKALDHWSTWELEYEMLKEELQGADSPSASQMIEIGRDMGGKLVTEKEVEELLGKAPQTQRTANQVIDMIGRRIDYVRQNRTSVEKQLDRAEKQLDAVSLLADPGLETEEGLPMMDIEEELDEDDKVISSSVSQPGKAAPELIEVLRKAGLHKTEQKDSKDDHESDEETTSSATPASAASSVSASKLISGPAKSSEQSSTPKPIAEGKAKASGAPKKSVSFANEVQVETFEKPKTFQDDVINWNLKPGAKVYELDDEAEVVGKAVVPDTDTPEEAALRREMLQYGLSEVNNIVAELDLEDDQESDEDVDVYEDEDYDVDSDEEEDEFGRSTRRVLTEDYMQQMRDLEKKLNARMVENFGPRSDLLDKADDIRTLRVRKDDEFEQSMSTSMDSPTEYGPPKKGVRFADDISDAPQAAEQPAVPIMLPPTISDTIVERATSVPQPPTAPSKPAKVSRFKSVRASADGAHSMLPTPTVPEPPPVPKGPSDRVLASSITEHTPHPSKPQAPDELDPVVHSREIQTEYHRLRNKMVQQQGGFRPTEEDEEDPLVEERDGKMKKVSRFKAARLKAEGL